MVLPVGRWAPAASARSKTRRQTRASNSPAAPGLDHSQASWSLDTGLFRSWLSSVEGLARSWRLLLQESLTTETVQRVFMHQRHSMHKALSLITWERELR